MASCETAGDADCLRNLPSDLDQTPHGTSHDPSVHLTPAPTPDKIAYQMAGTGKAITYRELDDSRTRARICFARSA